VVISSWRMRRPSPRSGWLCQSADHEGAGAGAAGQAGGFGIEEQQVLRLHVLAVALGEGQRQRLGRNGLRDE